MLNNLKKINIALIILLFLSILACKASANEQDTRVSELDYVDKKLNILYKKIFNQIKHANQKKLQKAQRTWILFRNQDCTWAFNAEPLDCMIHRTEMRIKELSQTEFFDIEGNYLSVDEE